MDRRSILFVLSLSTTLFLVNTYFQNQNIKEIQDRVKTHKELAEKNSVENSHVKETISIIDEAPSTSSSEEKFYVIENEYQQLVFSNIGGALAEVNLPFRTDLNHKSVVKEIDFDREMATKHPQNAHFPAHSFFKVNADGELQAHENGVLGGYYPLLRRDLVQTPPFKNFDISPKYYALNLTSNYPETSLTPYDVTHFDQSSITFEAQVGRRKITKKFFIDGKNLDAPYCLRLEMTVDGNAQNLWLTSGVPEVEWISGAAAPTLKYRVTRNGKADVEKIDLPSQTIIDSSSKVDWICNSNGFLGMITNPLGSHDIGYKVEKVAGEEAPSRLIEIDQEYNRFKAADLPGYMTLVPVDSGLNSVSFFAGPFDEKILNQVDSLFSDPQTGYNPNYIACQTMHGWFTFISEPFSKLLQVLLNFFHFLTNSWALSIALLTASLRLMLYPLNAWSSKSMAKMQQVAPEVTAIQEKYKKDPKKAQVEIMTLYRERGVNPMSGCLPLLIQMPFLIGMFDLLKSSFALRGATFIPGWIDDLTAPDVLFSWSKPIFFFGTQFHLLPFLIGAVMFLQQRLMSTGPSNPAQMSEQQRQQRAMGLIMTLVFTFMFYNFPSGLNIYWLSSMIFGMIQQWHTNRQIKSLSPIVKVKGKK